MLLLLPKELDSQLAVGLPNGSLGGLDGVVGGEKSCINLDFADDGNRCSNLFSTFGSTTRSPVLLLNILSMTESGIVS